MEVSLFFHDSIEVFKKRNWIVGFTVRLASSSARVIPGEEVFVLESFLFYSWPGLSFEAYDIVAFVGSEEFRV